MFLKNKNIIFKIRRSKVTDYAALRQTMSAKFSFKIFVGSILIIDTSCNIGYTHYIEASDPIGLELANDPQGEFCTL